MKICKKIICCCCFCCNLACKRWRKNCLMWILLSIDLLGFVFVIQCVCVWKSHRFCVSKMGRCYFISSEFECKMRISLKNRKVDQISLLWNVIACLFDNTWLPQMIGRWVRSIKWNACFSALQFTFLPRSYE